MLRIVPDENDPLLAGTSVIFLPESVCPDIPVEDIYVHCRIFLLESQGILDGPAAADPAAIHPALLAGAHTVDHDHG